MLQQNAGGGCIRIWAWYRQTFVRNGSLASLFDATVVSCARLLCYCDGSLPIESLCYKQARFNCLTVFFRILASSAVFTVCSAKPDNRNTRIQGSCASLKQGQVKSGPGPYRRVLWISDGFFTGAIFTGGSGIAASIHRHAGKCHYHFTVLVQSFGIAEYHAPVGFAA